MTVHVSCQLTGSPVCHAGVRTVAAAPLSNANRLTFQRLHSAQPPGDPLAVGLILPQA